MCGSVIDHIVTGARLPFRSGSGQGGSACTATYALRFGKAEESPAQPEHVGRWQEQSTQPRPLEAPLRRKASRRIQRGHRGCQARQSLPSLKVWFTTLILVSLTPGKVVERRQWKGRLHFLDSIWTWTRNGACHKG